jgi:hypothetical protein
MPDPMMPRQMPPAAEKALRDVLGWNLRPNPIDLYMTIRDALEREGPTGQSELHQEK